MKNISFHQNDMFEIILLRM